MFRSVIVLNLEKHQFCFLWLGILGVASIHIFLHELNKRYVFKTGQSGGEKICFNCEGLKNVMKNVVNHFSASKRKRKKKHKYMY